MLLKNITSHFSVHLYAMLRLYHCFEVACTASYWRHADFCNYATKWFECFFTHSTMWFELLFHVAVL